MFATGPHISENSNRNFTINISARDGSERIGFRSVGWFGWFSASPTHAKIRSLIN